MIKYLLILIILLTVQSCSGKNDEGKTIMIEVETTKVDSLTIGGGCFWCVEAVFQRIDGVVKIVSGYSGGTTKNPSYKEICTGTTGHAEVVKIFFDTVKVSINDILEVFFATHDPTTLNRQGADAGTQYRSVVFYNSEEQKKSIQKFIKLLQEEKVFPDPIITEVSPQVEFYPAEDYHQNYYNENSNQPYCMFVINPKIEKLRNKFGSKLKK